MHDGEGQARDARPDAAQDGQAVLGFGAVADGEVVELEGVGPGAGAEGRLHLGQERVRGGGGVGAGMAAGKVGAGEEAAVGGLAHVQGWGVDDAVEEAVWRCRFGRRCRPGGRRGKKKKGLCVDEEAGGSGDGDGEACGGGEGGGAHAGSKDDVVGGDGLAVGGLDAGNCLFLAVAVLIGTEHEVCHGRAEQHGALGLGIGEEHARGVGGLDGALLGGADAPLREEGTAVVVIVIVAVSGEGGLEGLDLGALDAADVVAPCRVLSDVGLALFGGEVPLLVRGGGGMKRVAVSEAPFPFIG